MLHKEGPRDQPPVKIPATKLLRSFPCTQHFLWAITVQCWRLNASCVSPWGEDSEGRSWSLRDFALCLFPLLALCPFTIINLSCERDYVLSPASLPDLGVSIGNPQHSR